MTIRGRVERLERHKRAGGLPCPGCGWDGPILYFNEYHDGAGRRVRLEDGAGNTVPGFPDIPPCTLCHHDIKYVVVRHPVSGQRPGRPEA